ncbi:MAG TPA: UvrD-helicase domain-containing protein [Mobilitalea sp.]|nr:UvrD-helicase domain-containing protein [Mobilitalea sp.]
MAWTEAQQKVIDTRNKNLLVSAAAGSGKTAVLVERIINMISEGEDPMDIDRLLVVTFTNAAAAEMRERIGKAIDAKLMKNPGNVHLQKQVSLLQSAQITTIHSFCLNVIRNYFHRIVLDPSFKIAEESEITLMKSDVISDILERWYEEGRDDFHAFIESYSYSKSDAPVEELILQLYNFSMSDPWPKTWIAEKKKMFQLASLEDMYQTSWMKELLEYIRVVLGDLLVKNAQAMAVCNESGGPGAYLPALLSDRNTLEILRDADSYEESSRLFTMISFERLSNKKDDSVEPWKKEKVKELREEVKKGLKDLTGQFFFQSPEEMLKDLQAVNQVIQVLFDLTLEFMDEFAKKKEDKNLIDFNDLEHFALKILAKEGPAKDDPVKEGPVEEEPAEVGPSEEHLHRNIEHKLPTQAALELREQFEEILIDEYQDSNMVQETILRSISREDMGKPNRFMVGDVKQSIYKFRLAMPEIFMEKYGSYMPGDNTEDGHRNNYQRIDLDKNFRSRQQVLTYVNKIFEQIMQQSVGGIIYDDTAALKYGELYEIKAEEDLHQLQGDLNSRLAKEVDFLLVTDEDLDNGNSGESIPEEGPVPERSSMESPDQDSQKKEDDQEEAAFTKKEIEARAIVKKIKELTDPDHGMLVMDKSTKALRPAAYRDIVILLRSMSNWSEVFVNTLMQEGIPAYADTGTGYFQTLEIMTLLNMLRIIDNPRQDIPLAGVLYSPMVGLSSTQLALLRASSRNTGMYTALLHYAAEGSEEELREKLVQFLKLLEDLRSMVNHKPIHELIQLVLDQTGYYYYVSAMPGGDRRKANIDMLISQAVRFEKGSYSGLFHFIRYIEKLHKYEVDFGEASTSGKQDDTVRIMSIHKSKGLEFPVVFVAGMSKQFNTQDLRSHIVLHSELGVGPEYIDSKLRTKVPTLLKKVIQKKVQIENLGEELRVLYVAMTRAKEKLILTGYIKSLSEIIRKDFSFFELLSAKSYLDWVLPAMLNRMGKIPRIDEIPFEWKKDEMSISVISQKELLKLEISKQLFLRKDEEDLIHINPDETYDLGLKEEIKTRFNYQYPHAKEADLKIKMTVSELKKLGQVLEDEDSVQLYPQIDYEILPSEKVDYNIAEHMKDTTDKPTAELITVHPDAEAAMLTKTDSYLPNFISQKETEITGTDRGTLYHKVLELLDLTKVYNKEDLMKDIDRMIREGRINQGDIKKLKLDYILRFIGSDAANRMRQAQLLHKLYKEKQFVMGIKASEVMKDSDSEELILIQGIIDVFFEEEGELVLLDYKSDLVEHELQLIGRYKVQLEYYRRALEQMLRKPVKEMLIYSLPLGKEIRIDK